MFALVVLAGCQPSHVDESDYLPKTIGTICLDGVEYYVYREGFTGYHGAGYMAVGYDADTGEIVRCNTHEN